MNGTRKGFKRALCFAVILMVGVVFSAVLPAQDVSAKTKDKAMKASVKFTGAKLNWADAENAADPKVMDEVSKNWYALGVLLKKKVTLTKKMKVSATYYIPAKLLKKKGSNVNVFPILAIDNGNEQTVQVWCKNVVVLSKGKSKVKVNMYNDKYKKVKVGKMAKLSKKTVKIGKQKYYVLKLNKMPLKTTGLVSENGQEYAVAIPTGKRPVQILSSIAAFGSKYKGALYMDNVTLKAKKTTKVTFDKKDYGKIHGMYTMNGKPIKVKRVTLKVK